MSGSLPDSLTPQPRLAAKPVIITLQLQVYAMKTASTLAFVGLLVLFSSSSLAQSTQTPQRFPDGGTRDILISILIPPIPNAPFSATVNTEWIRQLPDGSTITLKNHRAIARDKAGRIFQERRALIPDDSNHQSPVTQTEISDPVSQELYICVPQELVCQVETLPPPQPVPSPVDATTPKPPGSLGLEELGKRSIGGVETIGARETVVIPTGAIGNDRPLFAKREFWYSASLGVNLVSKRQDPRFGIQNFELSDIIVSEPDAKLFDVPQGAKVIDLRNPPEISEPRTPPAT
jgi:hypothetical protein